MTHHASHRNPLTIRTFTVALLIFATLSATAALGLRGVFAQDEGPVAPQAVGAFTSAGTLSFQGELRDRSSGAPLADGAYRMRFAIYDAESGGSRRWPNPAPDYEEHTAVDVEDGLFNVLLGSHVALPGSVFGDGGDRYVQVWVCPTAGTGCTSFEDLGRLPISSAGYAKAFVPGATVSGSGRVLTLSSTTTDGSVLNVSASAATGNAAGVYAQSNASEGAGLSGYNGSSGVGVVGGSFSGTGVQGRAPTLGVMGNATAGSGVAYGVKGQNASYNGAGVYGTSSYATGTGVKGESSAGPGVYGVSSGGMGAGGQSSSGVGLWGFSVSGDGVNGTSTSGAGLRATSGISGVVGTATRNTGINYGVYGQNASANGAGVYGSTTHFDGYGVYSDGDAHVEGDLTWKPITSYVSVAAAAFQPSDNSIDYYNDGYRVWHKGSLLDMKAYFAPITIPHQAELKSVSAKVCGWRPQVAGRFEFRLMRADRAASSVTEGPTELASVTSTWIDENKCVTYETSTFVDRIVDNSRYVYYLGAWMVGGTDYGSKTDPNLTLRGAIIEYTVDQPY